MSFYPSAAAPIVCPPVRFVNDRYYPTVVPVVHPIEVINRCHPVPVPHHLYPVTVRNDPSCYICSAGKKRRGR